MTQADSTTQCRALIADKLVGICSASIDASYKAYMRREENSAHPDWFDGAWNICARVINRTLLPVALRVDKEAAVDRMINEGWWG